MNWSLGSEKKIVLYTAFFACYNYPCYYYNYCYSYSFYYYFLPLFNCLYLSLQVSLYFVLLIPPRDGKERVSSCVVLVPDFWVKPQHTYIGNTEKKGKIKKRPHFFEFHMLLQ